MNIALRHRISTSHQWLGSIASDVLDQYIPSIYTLIRDMQFHYAVQKDNPDPLGCVSIHDCVQLSTGLHILTSMLATYLFSSWWWYLIPTKKESRPLKEESSRQYRTLRCGHTPGHMTWQCSANVPHWVHPHGRCFKWAEWKYRNYDINSFFLWSWLGHGSREASSPGLPTFFGSYAMKSWEAWDKANSRGAFLPLQGLTTSCSQSSPGLPRGTPVHCMDKLYGMSPVHTTHYIKTLYGYLYTVTMAT